MYFAAPEALAAPSTRATSVPTTASFASEPQGVAAASSIVTETSFATSPEPMRRSTLRVPMGYFAFAAATAAFRTWG